MYKEAGCRKYRVGRGLAPAVVDEQAANFRLQCQENICAKLYMRPIICHHQTEIENHLR